MAIFWVKISNILFRLLVRNLWKLWKYYFYVFFPMTVTGDGKYQFFHL